MIQKQRILPIALILFTMLIVFTGQTISLNTDSHRIQLTLGEEFIYVNEKINLEIIEDDTNITNLLFWIPTNADNIQSTVNNTIIPTVKIGGNVYQGNISDIKQATISSNTIELTYTLPVSIQQFSKTLLRNTSELMISYENTDIASASALSMNSSYSVSIPTESDKALFNVYTLTLTILLIILLLVSFVYGLRKRKNGKTRKRAFESDEVLSTEKTLLMDVLKKIEKLHRYEKMSDDTYHKLKGYYKQQTIEIMSQLEDTDSKIKKQ